MSKSTCPQDLTKALRLSKVLHSRSCLPVYIQREWWNNSTNHALEFLSVVALETTW